MQKEKAIILIVNFDFDFLPLKPMDKMYNVCMAHCNVQGLTVKFCSGFQVSCSSKVERKCQIVFSQFKVCSFSAQHLCILTLWGGKNGPEWGCYMGICIFPHFKLLPLAHAEKRYQRSHCRSMALAQRPEHEFGKLGHI